METHKQVRIPPTRSSRCNEKCADCPISETQHKGADIRAQGRKGAKTKGRRDVNLQSP